MPSESPGPYLDPARAERAKRILASDGFAGHDSPHAARTAAARAMQTGQLIELTAAPVGTLERGLAGAAAEEIFARADSDPEAATAAAAALALPPVDDWDPDEVAWEAGQHRRGLYLDDCVTSGRLTDVSLRLLDPTLRLARLRQLDPWLTDPVVPIDDAGHVAFVCRNCGVHVHEPRAGDHWVDPASVGVDVTGLEKLHRPLPAALQQIADSFGPAPVEVELIPADAEPWFLEIVRRCQPGQIRISAHLSGLYPDLVDVAEAPPGRCGHCETIEDAAVRLLTAAEVLDGYHRLADEPAHDTVIAGWRRAVARLAPDELIDRWA